jgi:hypothetical protein
MQGRGEGVCTLPSPTTTTPLRQLFSRTPGARVRGAQHPAPAPPHPTPEDIVKDAAQLVSGLTQVAENKWVEVEARRPQRGQDAGSVLNTPTTTTTTAAGQRRRCDRAPPPPPSHRAVQSTLRSTPIGVSLLTPTSTHRQPAVMTVRTDARPLALPTAAHAPAAAHGHAIRVTTTLRSRPAPSPGRAPLLQLARGSMGRSAKILR